MTNARFYLQYAESPDRFRPHILSMFIDYNGFNVALTHDIMYYQLPQHEFFQVEEIIEKINESCKTSIITSSRYPKLGLKLATWKFSRTHIAWGFQNKADAMMIKMRAQL